MCIFSAYVASVGDTRIFARRSTGRHQFLVYSMQYEADSDLAMILPLPTPPSPAEDAVRFIDLSSYPHFFDDMRKGFVEPVTRSLSLGPIQPGKSILQVHDVGSFEASFVPHRGDFARLDDRFRLPDVVWEQLPRYDDYAFAVFRLKAGAVEVHPMAFEFPRRNETELFFPTVHIHHGEVEPLADFDHTLYCQTSQLQRGWIFSASHEDASNPLAARHFMDMRNTKGIVDAAGFVQKKRVVGTFPNEDVVVSERG